MKAQTLRHEKEAVHGGSHLLSQHWKAEVVELLQVQSHPELQCETFLFGKKVSRGNILLYLSLWEVKAAGSGV